MVRLDASAICWDKIRVGGVRKLAVATYVEIRASCPYTALETDDSRLADLAGADEVGVYVSLPRHGGAVKGMMCARWQTRWKEERVIGGWGLEKREGRGGFGVHGWCWFRPNHVAGAGVVQVDVMFSPRERGGRGSCAMLRGFRTKGGLSWLSWSMRRRRLDNWLYLCCCTLL